MKQKDAPYLLFIQEFGNGPLFKNQTELAIELINDPRTDYYCPKADIINYNKSVSRLKAYLSQLFSDSARRNVTTEFKRSLEKILTNKINPSTVREELLDNIITDLREKNNKVKAESSQNLSRRDFEVYSDFINNIIDAKYIAVFTAREIRFEYEAIGQKFSLIDFLVEDFLESLKKEKAQKFYRFNFPLEQTCQLFWRGLRKELSKYLKKDPATFGTLVAISRKNGWFNFEGKSSTLFENEEIEKVFSSTLLDYLSKNSVINVFHLKQPVYLTPSIAINPNGGQEQNTYLLLQSGQGEEVIHKFSNEEYIFWKLFVWDNLKGNKQGKPVEYSDKF